ncbi:hypothetical protein JYU14_05180 [Simkania negevensis]|uniref:Uncharacterized protein n=1 Tax=Simkania negevensis TaxID=83561 RepID=A0ABS3ARU9_9BACT|nr:hypothetical protein [Simkania negevensis]
MHPTNGAQATSFFSKIAVTLLNGEIRATHGCCCFDDPKKRDELENLKQSIDKWMQTQPWLLPTPPDEKLTLPNENNFTPSANACSSSSSGDSDKSPVSVRTTPRTPSNPSPNRHYPLSGRPLNSHRLHNPLAGRPRESTTPSQEDSTNSSSSSLSPSRRDSDRDSSLANTPSHQNNNLTPARTDNNQTVATPSTAISPGRKRSVSFVDLPI